MAGKGAPCSVLCNMVSKLRLSCRAGRSGRKSSQCNHWGPGLLATIAPLCTNTHANSGITAFAFKSQQAHIKTPRYANTRMFNKQARILICICAHGRIARFDALHSPRFARLEVGENVPLSHKQRKSFKLYVLGEASNVENLCR